MEPDFVASCHWADCCLASRVLHVFTSSIILTIYTPDPLPPPAGLLPPELLLESSQAAPAAASAAGPNQHQKHAAAADFDW